MLAAISLNAFLTQFMRLIVGFSIYSGWDLQEKLPFDVRSHKFIERQKFGLYFVETKVIL